MSWYGGQAKEDVTFLLRGPFIGNSQMNQETTIQWNIIQALRSVKGQVVGDP